VTLNEVITAVDAGQTVLKRDPTNPKVIGRVVRSTEYGVKGYTVYFYDLCAGGIRDAVGLYGEDGCGLNGNPDDYFLN
jgi:hypothetical protein